MLSTALEATMDSATLSDVCLLLAAVLSGVAAWLFADVPSKLAAVAVGLLALALLLV